MTDEQCLSAFPAESFFLTRYRSAPLPACIDVYLYRVKARRLPAEKEASVLARLAMRLGRANDGIPVVRLSGKTLVAFEELDELSAGEPGIDVEPAVEERLNIHCREGRKALLRLARGYVKRRAAAHGFVVGIADFILSPRFRMKDDGNKMGLQTGVVFSLSLDGGNVLVLDCDMRSKILLQKPLSERLREDGFQIEGCEVSSLGTAGTMLAEKVLDRTVGQVDKALGVSIIEYNRRRGRYPEGFEPDPACPVVQCRVEGSSKRYNYDPQLLHEVLDLKRVRRLDAGFASALADAMRMDTAERERYCTYFVRQVSKGGPSWLTFETEAEVVGRANDYRAFDVALPRENLLFGGGRRERTVENGIVRYGLFSGPGPVRLGVLLPARHERASATRLDRILAELEGLSAGKASFETVFEEVYDSGNPFRIQAAVAALTASEAELALVLLPGRGERSPYGLLKAELAKKRFPSQMVHLDTHLSRREAVNILVGLTAKLGRSENWRLDSLLWPPDLFIGIGSGRVDDERIAAVATAFDRCGRALDVTVEIFSSAEERIPEARLIHLLEGALLAYRAVDGNLPAAVVLHRDGDFVEASYKRAWGHFKELGVAMTLVAVDTGLPPRIGRLKRDRREAPLPGSLVLTGEASGLVITSAPRGPRGCPRPVAFERCSGLVDARALGGQIFWLSRAHMGSITPPRLPVTVHFARKVIGMVCDGLVPQWTMGSRMLFV